MSQSSFLLVVEQIIAETAAAKTLYLQIDDDLRSQFSFQAGQYVEIEMQDGDEVMSRSFPISTAPHEKKFAITVRQMSDDAVSTYLTQGIQVGDQITVYPPEGKFLAHSDPDHRFTYYLITVGYGIAPIYSILKDVLENEPLSTIYLIYGNRNYESIIFRDELIQLADQYTDQLHLQFILSQPQKYRYLEYWNQQIGHIDRGYLERFLVDHPKQTPKEKFFLCGPERMINDLSQVLLDMGYNHKQIFSERFTNEHLLKKEVIMSEKSSRATIHLDGEKVEIDIKDDTVLQTLIDAGFDPPFSCTSGVCTTCMAKLVKGNVEMEVNYGLDEDEVAEGYILTCQSHPCSDEIELTYDI